MKNLLWGIVLGTLLLSACGAPAASQPTPVVVVVVITNTPPPSATATAVPPTPSATLAPSNTPQPSKTPIPTKTSMPTMAVTLTTKCNTELAAFKAQILAVRKAYRPLVEDVYNYSVELLANDYDEADVDSAFAGIDAIVVPSCVDAGEILYYFRLLRDTLGPAYVEMRIESALQYPNQDSFELVAGWYQEIEGFEKDINALIATLP
jgi:hypothetical protein